MKLPQRSRNKNNPVYDVCDVTNNFVNVRVYDFMSQRFRAAVNRKRKSQARLRVQRALEQPERRHCFLARSV